MINEVEHLFLCLSPFGEMSLHGLCPFFWLGYNSFNLRAEELNGALGLLPIHAPSILDMRKQKPRQV